MCQERLPLSESLGLHGAVICPHCLSELQLKRWIQMMQGMVPFLAMTLLGVLLRASGLSFVPTLLIALGGSIIVTLSFHVCLGRYRLKPPRQSITRTFL